mmetsp:Transcript_92149/g.298051  ORF Transcript_92149/g.298051 Transcript_92149/m.298051 type:complete len:234 (+) Transcript_92149:560-1261(+)
MLPKAALEILPATIQERGRHPGGSAKGHVVGGAVADHQELRPGRHAPEACDLQQRGRVRLGGQPVQGGPALGARREDPVARDRGREMGQALGHPQPAVELTDGRGTIPSHHGHWNTLRGQKAGALCSARHQHHCPGPFGLHLIDDGGGLRAALGGHESQLRQYVLFLRHATSPVHLPEVQVRHRQRAVHVEDHTAQPGRHSAARGGREGPQRRRAEPPTTLAGQRPPHAAALP